MNKTPFLARFVLAACAVAIVFIVVFLLGTMVIWGLDTAPDVTMASLFLLAAFMLAIE